MFISYPEIKDKKVRAELNRTEKDLFRRKEEKASLQRANGLQQLDEIFPRALGSALTDLFFPHDARYRQLGGIRTQFATQCVFAYILSEIKQKHPYRGVPFLWRREWDSNP